MLFAVQQFLPKLFITTCLHLTNKLHHILPFFILALLLKFIWSLSKHCTSIGDSGLLLKDFLIIGCTDSSGTYKNNSFHLVSQFILIYKNVQWLVFYSLLYGNVWDQYQEVSWFFLFLSRPIPRLFLILESIQDQYQESWLWTFLRPIPIPMPGSLTKWVCRRKQDFSGLYGTL